MDDTVGCEFEIDGSAWQAADRARTLRIQADWCVDMAAKVSDPRLFQAYVQAATAYQQQARMIEGGISLENSSVTGLLSSSV